jgi:N-6 DNA Methylase.
MLTWDEIQENAVKFSKKWKNAHSEEAQAQAFELEFFKAFDVEALDVGAFEHQVPKEIEGKGYIDYLWKGKIAIEMKSKGKDLDKAYTQLKEYIVQLPAEEIPDLLMVCDFETIIIYRRGKGGRKQFKVRELSKNIRQFANIAGYELTREIEDQIEVNVNAAEKMAVLHDALKDSGYEGHDLEVYLVRLLFCLFADDTGIFPQQSFLNYIENSKADGSDLSDRIARLFEVLNMPDNVRAKRTLLSADLRQFRYINGRLFADPLPSADFNSKMRRTLIDCSHFAWSAISPAIFGAMFQGVMDKAKRRELGAHYTSEENILKLIKPLFLDELWDELERVRYNKKLLEQFHEKLGTLKFLDPACGCGNFLIITYRELRHLELEVLKQKIGDKKQLRLDVSDLLKVTVEQFYGIECEDFPCQVAQVGMWLMDHQMNLRVQEQFGQYFVRLPLAQSAAIVHGNALRIDWTDVVPKRELSYILGNPPFKGFKYATLEQKEDMRLVFGEICNTALLDYVSAWYKTAAEYMQGAAVQVAFVSTNSIVQGTQVGQLWGILLEKYHVHINFAHQTFKWSNEAKGKAAVHCVIIGFSLKNKTPKLLVDYDDAAGEGVSSHVDKINPYLLNADNVVVTSRTKPLCGVPELFMGNQATDGGNLIIDANIYEEFIEAEPLAKKWIRRYMMGHEFINNITRYCLWLKDCPPTELRQMPHVLERVNNVRKTRLNSTKKATVKNAEKPTLFEDVRQPDSSYIAIPITSSEARRYIPIGYLDRDTIAGNTLFIIADASMYHFGILTSNVHMSWMRIVGARLKSDYRYSKDIVYNNFPWPEVTDKQKIAIEEEAQGVLDARALFPNSSLADLYDPLTMPPALSKAHQSLDRLVMQAYGFSATNTTEANCVAKLMQLYQKLAEKK